MANVALFWYGGNNNDSRTLLDTVVALVTALALVLGVSGGGVVYITLKLLSAATTACFVIKGCSVHSNTR